MKINFTSLDTQIIIERIFDFIPAAFPDLTQLQIKGDDQFIPLAFHTDDLMAKSIDLVYNRYQSLGKLTLKLILNNGSKQIQLQKIGDSNYMSLRYNSVETVQSLLFPYQIITTNSEYFYRDDLKSSSWCSELHINDYLFENYQRQLDGKIIYTQLETALFRYHVNIFLNDIDRDRLLKILLLQLARQIEPYTRLNEIRLSTAVEWDSADLDQLKLLHFSIPEFAINGTINPIKKELRIS
ncbi:MAG: hypothetical protein KDD94_01250 [Calditrichaeota bacterium]|nr:hypothetical protein [Calditrichota bacterium]